MRNRVVSGISHRFRWLSPSEGQITHVLLTRSPLEYPRRSLSARLACVKHAASVRPEPGSNSPLKNNTHNHNPKKAAIHGKKEPTPGKKQTSSYSPESLPYQRNHPSTPTPPPTPQKEAQTRSQPKQKTGHNKLIRRLFDTLLSSQESDAHRPPTSRPEQRGNLQKLTGSDPPSQLGSILAGVGARNYQLACLAAGVGSRLRRQEER
jgi:hypothetical protein